MFRSRRPRRPHPRRPAGRGGPRPAQRVGSTGRPAVGEHHHQAAARAVARLLPHHHVAGRQQPLRQRRFPAGVEAAPACGLRCEPTTSAAARPGPAAAERDHRDLVPTLICIAQQRQRGAADRRHPITRRHRARRVDDEDHQIAFAAFANRAADVIGSRTAADPVAAGDRAAASSVANMCTPVTLVGLRCRGRRSFRCGCAHATVGQVRPPPRRAPPAPGSGRRRTGAALGRDFRCSNYRCGAGCSESVCDAPPPPGGSGSGSGPVIVGLLACVCAIASSSCWGSRPGSSNGSRLRRCGSASSAATRMSSSPTVSRSAPRCVRDRGAGHHQVGAHPVDVECRAQRGDAA